MVGDWLFGCDVCQEVCPWNDKFGLPTDEPRFAPRPDVVTPHLEELATLSDDEFARRYADTAFERPGRKGISRNALQVMANRGSVTFTAEDTSSAEVADELVRCVPP